MQPDLCRSSSKSVYMLGVTDVHRCPKSEFTPALHLDTLAADQSPNAYCPSSY